VQSSFHVGYGFGFYCFLGCIVVGWFFILTIVTLFALGLAILENEINRRD